MLVRILLCTPLFLILQVYGVAFLGLLHLCLLILALYYAK